MNRSLRLAPAVAVSLLLFPAFAHAGGFRILDQSASGTAQSNAITAQADDPSAVYYNPAGMTQLRGVQFSIGTLLIGGTTAYTSPTGQTGTGTFDGSIAYPPPSNLYITANLKDLGVTALGDLSAGLAVVAPFGTLQRWPNSGVFTGVPALSGQANTDLTFQSLELLNIKPTLAYRLTDQLSFGIGADIYTFASFWGQGQAETQLNSSGLGALAPLGGGTPLEINGKDTAAGFNVSMMYTPLRNAEGKPLANIGLVYRSQATLHLKGQFLAAGALVMDANTTLVLPQIITGGIALWPVRDQDHEWKLELDVDYTDWKSVRNSDVHLSDNSTIPVNRNWRSGFTPMIGTEYKWLRPEKLPHWEIAARAGYWFSQTPIPDATFSPGVPDSDNHAISFGLGLMCKDKGRFLGMFQCGSEGGHWYRPKAVGLDVAFQTLIYETRTVSGSQPALTIPGAVDGKYETTYYVGSINLRVNF